jgi:chromosome condensin MukBEF ATPase and DNA-binding subunit MukB
MITPQELQSAIVTVEQYLKDCEKEKGKHKHDTEQIKKWSAQLSDSKIKLQVLHYAIGLANIITEERLHADIAHLSEYLKNLQRPREVDLFISEDEKKLIQEQRIMALKLFTLKFIAGMEKKII